MAATTRSTEEIRRSIQANRSELTMSIGELTVKTREIADWRAHLRRNPTASLAGAAAAGFLLGGGLAGFFSLFSRR